MSNIAGNPFYIASIIFLVLSLGTLLSALIVFFKLNVVNAIRIVSNKAYVSNSAAIEKANKKSKVTEPKVSNVHKEPVFDQNTVPQNVVAKTEPLKFNQQYSANETVMLNRNQSNSANSGFRIIKNLVYVNTSEVIK